MMNEPFNEDSGYKALRQHDSGLNGALELPAIRALLPELSHLNMLNLGSGFGDFARYARANGAAHVTGIELSTRMLAEAQRLTDDPGINFVQISQSVYITRPCRIALADINRRSDTQYF